ncbi:MAG: metallophosphoesterase [Candidatus Pacearchaeota archaeon]
MKLKNLEKFEIEKNIFLIDKAIWLKKQKLLGIADLHIGYEENLIEQGILLPKKQFKIIKEEIINLINKLKPKIVLINGDVKHEFGEISKQEWKETNEIIDIIMRKSKVILIKGNHDTILEPIAKRKGLKILDYYIVNNICFMHGHKIYNEIIKNKKIKIIVLAHIHPAISLREGIKIEKYKCWLIGKWKNKKIIIMPSFIFYVEGIDISNYKFDEIFLKNIENFDIYAIGDKIYWLGKLKDIVPGWRNW